MFSLCSHNAARCARGKAGAFGCRCVSTSCSTASCQAKPRWRNASGVDFPLTFRRGASLHAGPALSADAPARRTGFGSASRIVAGRGGHRRRDRSALDPSRECALAGGDEADAAASALPRSREAGRWPRAWSHSDVDLTPDQAVAGTPRSGRHGRKVQAARRIPQRSGAPSRCCGNGAISYWSALLLVRPVRHLLRGALLDKTGQVRASCRAYIMPLYDGSPDGSGQLGHIRREEYVATEFRAVASTTWENIFDPLRSITTIAICRAMRARKAWIVAVGRISRPAISSRGAGAGHLAGDALDQARITALVLAGEVDRAAAFVAVMIRGGSAGRHWAQPGCT